MSRTPQNKPDLDRAYNAGSDARIAGKWLSECPEATERLRYYWRLGWEECDKNWGMWSKRPVMALPPLPPWGRRVTRGEAAKDQMESGV